MTNTYPKLAVFNNMYTPKIWMDYIIPFLDPKLVYYEMCYWEWHMAWRLEDAWYLVVWEKWLDCFLNNDLKYDFVITNIPFSNNKKFIKRAIELWKPFALLCRLEHLWWVSAMQVLWDLDFQIIIPEKRINYIKIWEKVSSSPFHSIWLTYWLNLPKQINYIKL
jgi:hypothetical protein